MRFSSTNHWVKSVRIGSTDQNNSKYGHLLRSVWLIIRRVPDREVSQKMQESKKCCHKKHLATKSSTCKYYLSVLFFRKQNEIWHILFQNYWNKITKLFRSRGKILRSEDVFWCFLTLSRYLSYRNHSIDLHWKSMVWFLYDIAYFVPKLLE